MQKISCISLQKHAFLKRVFLLREVDKLQKLVFACLCSGVTVFQLNACGNTRKADPSVVYPLEERFSPQEEPYAFVLPAVKPVKGAGLRAEECGACHKTIYDDWKKSTHAQALHDLQFQAELSKPSSPKWLCLNCHTPVANQREYLVAGLYGRDVMRPDLGKNPAFNRAMQAEGVSCATCHIRSNAKGESFIYGPNGSTQAPHPVRKSRKFLRNMCMRCHNPQGEAVTPNLTCWFHTVEEMEDAKQGIGHAQTKPLPPEADCVGCHMPARPGYLADNFRHLPKRQLNHHYWTGGGIPKTFAGYPDLLKRAYKSGLSVEFSVAKELLLGQKNSFAVKLKNEHAGHDLPTGDPERFLLAILRVLDATGKELDRSSYRIGQTWQWSPAKKIADNRLKYGESRTWKAELFLDQRRAKKIELHVFHVKLTKANFRHMKKQSNQVSEKLYPKAKEKLKQAEKHYPVATWLYRKDYDLQTKKERLWKTQELLQLSSKERLVSVENRIYWGSESSSQ